MKRTSDYPKIRHLILIFLLLLQIHTSKNKNLALKKVVEVFRSKKVAVILFDDSILKTLQKFNKVENLPEFPGNVKLAILANSLNNDLLDDVCTQLEKDVTLSIEITKGPDPWSVDDQKSIHYFFAHQDESSVEVTFLYERLSQYWWYYNHKNDPFNEKFSRFKIMNIFDLKSFVIDATRLLVPLHLKNFVLELRNGGNNFMPCNYSRSIEFYKKYPQDASDEAEHFRERAQMLLMHAKNVLDQLGIPFWLSSGTCLGFHRQCDIITYSKDVDIGIFISDYKPELIPRFVSSGLRLIHLFGKEEDSFELSFEQSGVKLDIFFFYKEDRHYWNGGVQAKSGRKFKYTFPKFSLCWTEFLQMTLRVPCEIEEYIKANYGEDWSVPTTKWDWKSSPPNVQENGAWPKSLWPVVIQIGQSQCSILGS